jgi:outer membrane protein OmpA-like peptidoglycan-associated protein
VRATILAFVLALFATAAFADSAVKVATDRLVLVQPILFEPGKDVAIKHESHAILDAVAATLAKETRLALLEVQGHTDARGAEEWNLEVSQKRAEAVVAYLVGKGVASGRLKPKGYGESKPLKKHAAKSSRIEIVILQRAAK